MPLPTFTIPPVPFCDIVASAIRAVRCGGIVLQLNSTAPDHVAIVTQDGRRHLRSVAFDHQDLIATPKVPCKLGRRGSDRSCDKKDGARGAYTVATAVVRMRRRGVGVRGDDVELVKTSRGVRAARFVVDNGDPDWRARDVGAGIVAGAGVDGIDLHQCESVAHGYIECDLALLITEKAGMAVEKHKGRAANDQENRRSNDQFE